MPKAGIHPAIHPLTVTLSHEGNPVSFKTSSTSSVGEIIPEVPFWLHPAWNRTQKLSDVQLAGRVGKFKEKHGLFAAMMSSSSKK